MTRALTIEERFGHAKVFEAQPVADMKGEPTGATFNVCIATFDNTYDAALFMGIAQVEPKYQVEMLTSRGEWVNTGHVPTTNRALAEAALAGAIHEAEAWHPNRKHRLATVWTVSVGADTTEALTREYETWLKAEGLADLEGNAQEILTYAECLTGAQRVWLGSFIARWTVAEKAEDEACNGRVVTDAEWTAFEEAAGTAHQANYDARGDRYATPEELKMHLADPLADYELVKARLITTTGLVCTMRGRLRPATEAEKAEATKDVAYTDSFKEGA